MSESYYLKSGIQINENITRISEDERYVISRLLNWKLTHTKEQINQICDRIEPLLIDQQELDHEASLPRQSSDKEKVEQLNKLINHLNKAQKIIRNDFGLDIENFIDIHYLTKTGKSLPDDYMYTYPARGPLEDILYRLEQATTDTRDNQYQELSETKRKPNLKSRQYHHLIQQMSKACGDAGVKFQIKSKYQSPFYRLVEWVIKTKLGDSKRNSLEALIESALKP